MKYYFQMTTSDYGCGLVRATRHFVPRSSTISSEIRRQENLRLVEPPNHTFSYLLELNARPEQLPDKICVSNSS